MSLRSSTTTGLSCWGSPTSNRLLPRRMGTSDTAVLHWLASSITTMSNSGFGSPSLWAELQVVAMMGKMRSSSFRFSCLERYLLNSPTSSRADSGDSRISRSGSLRLSRMRRIYLAEV